ncbi:MAG TPA: lysylphosphatidylglycerol synthase transmembrane domain-containing protein, partial [Acidimicrobiales bacterium]
DSGPTLTFTRRQQVEHEAYVTLMADRAGARVARVLAAGPAGPARDALLVTRPPTGRLLSELAPFVLPPDPSDADGDPVDATIAAELPVLPSVTDPVLTDAALDGIFAQVMALRSAGIAHGSLSTETIVLADDGTSGLIDMRAAATVATADQLDRDLAATLAATALVAGPERATAAAARTVSTDAIVAALPFLQRAALDPRAARTLRGNKAILTAVRTEGAQVAGIEVPKLIEPRRISWINLALVVGTLIGGWALIGVLVNVTKSWSTITGADWGWVAAVFVLAQAAYPALAVATVGSVTDTLPYGRTVALEVANTFVALAGGSMGALATRVRFFQQQGYDATLAVSSGVLISTASWIVKGGLFVIAIPIAISQFNFGDQPTTTGGGSGSSTARLVWIIVLAIAVIGILLGLIFAIPRWRRLAAAKLRPKASEVWGHLKLLSTHPRNLVEIFGGEIVAQILVAMALGAALHAFNQHLSLASLIIVLTLGSMIGGISPVPGGMGVVEAGMILALTAAGIPENDAVAAVFVQRLFTAYLPPIWGWFCLIWMRKREYL